MTVHPGLPRPQAAQAGTPSASGIIHDQGAATERNVRRWLHEALDPRARAGPGLSPLNRILVALIFVALLLGIVETEPAVAGPYGGAFALAELCLGLIFALEYGLRLWSAPERDPTAPAWAERLRFIASPAAIADLVAIFASLAMVGSGGALLLRLVRLGRILRLAKLGRMSRAFDHMAEAVASRRDELLLTLVAGLGLMVVAATALYLAEGAVQPDKFGSIPRALWWSVATMTTVGYGDVYPVTALGKVLAAATALLGIGLVAMPTGILAAAFSDAMQRHRQLRQEVPPANSRRRRNEPQ